MDKAEDSRSISGPNDSFAGLADLMRSKKPWITAQNSQLQRLVPGEWFHTGILHQPFEITRSDSNHILTCS